MSAASERRRPIDVADVAAHITAKLAEWAVPDADVLWAIRKGGARPNDKRSKRLMAASQFGASRLVPFDGDWTVRGNPAVLNALELIEAELAATAASSSTTRQ